MGESAPEITGMYSLVDSDKTGKWDCVKQINLKPDLGSINGDNPGDNPAAQDKWQ